MLIVAYRFEFGISLYIGEIKNYSMELKIQRLDKSLTLPCYARANDAGLDLRSREDMTLHPMEKLTVKTGIKVALPQGHVGLIWDKSGLSSKHGIHTLAGVVDEGYRGEIGVVLINLGKETFEIEKNMKIAQMVVQPVLQAQVSEVEELDETHRGDGGFGSTGLH